MVHPQSCPRTESCMAYGLCNQMLELREWHSAAGASFQLAFLPSKFSFVFTFLINSIYGVMAGNDPVE